MSPILILLVGMAVVLGAIIVLRLNAFLALIGAAVLVSLLAPGEPGTKIARVAQAFGSTAGSIGIVIALAAIIGKAMMDSGAADRIVRAFLRLLGEDQGATALLASGFALAIPVFFDTVFYLLIPLARSMYRRTGRNYLKYITAIAAGAAATHALVPPTPGPLVVAGMLGVDLGTMILVGLVVALPAAVVGLFFAGWIDRRMPVPLRTGATGIPEAAPTAPPALPGLTASLLPIVLPVVLIASNTLIGSLAKEAGAHGGWAALAPYAAIVGDANLALLLSAAVALWVYARQRRPSRAEMAAAVEEALMSGGVIILITAAGGAFGAMLQAAQIGPAIQALFAGGAGTGLVYLFLAFGVASLVKVAQGSSTVAMITTAAMLSTLIQSAGVLPFHTAYVATAIASGSLVGSWMNDSGFWVFTKMGGVTEIEALKSWTPALAIVGITSMVTTVALALVLPLV
ncbi:MAG TPA: SLC13 family permease [Longimicrobiaceae bacterium]|nr:SLC13 family permease [Longimicrobiaceae bacterium]